ncbi:hypothetical protein BOTBODRAFT_182769 [Botryobasidium botryosum FD-172 SS1]|uniref:Uncharacterized protein n=1 Tax=Botryobasidium botryosum (strain FD-172 SS1) TaxID=930990 RepID=A0A067NCE1_BOTB1|nr:hypothetical protein BOTBODRAFT_182769 [Botryobasidium botryosum FD-172 SS1]
MPAVMKPIGLGIFGLSDFDDESLVQQSPQAHDARRERDGIDHSADRFASSPPCLQNAHKAHDLRTSSGDYDRSFARRAAQPQRTTPSSSATLNSPAPGPTTRVDALSPQPTRIIPHTPHPSSSLSPLTSTPLLPPTPTLLPSADSGVAATMQTQGEGHQGNTSLTTSIAVGIVLGVALIAGIGALIVGFFLWRGGCRRVKDSGRDFEDSKARKESLEDDIGEKINRKVMFNEGSARRAIPGGYPKRKNDYTSRPRRNTGSNMLDTALLPPVHQQISAPPPSVRAVRPRYAYSAGTPNGSPRLPSHSTMYPTHQSSFPVTPTLTPHLSLASPASLRLCFPSSAPPSPALVFTPTALTFGAHVEPGPAISSPRRLVALNTSPHSSGSSLASIPANASHAFENGSLSSESFESTDPSDFSHESRDTDGSVPTVEPTNSETKLANLVAMVTSYMGDATEAAIKTDSELGSEEMIVTEPIEIDPRDHLLPSFKDEDLYPTSMLPSSASSQYILPAPSTFFSRADSLAPSDSDTSDGSIFLKPDTASASTSTSASTLDISGFAAQGSGSGLLTESALPPPSIIVSLPSSKKLGSLWGDDDEQAEWGAELRGGGARCAKEEAEGYASDEQEDPFFYDGAQFKFLTPTIPVKGLPIQGGNAGALKKHPIPSPSTAPSTLSTPSASLRPEVYVPTDNQHATSAHIKRASFPLASFSLRDTYGDNDGARATSLMLESDFSLEFEGSEWAETTLGEMKRKESIVAEA